MTTKKREWDGGSTLNPTGAPCQNSSQYQEKRRETGKLSTSETDL